jgi:hypothetical protein
MRRDRQRWMQALDDGLRYGSGVVSGPQLVFSELVVVLFIGAASLFASLGFGLERQSHFGCRVFLFSLVPPSLVLVVTGAVELHALPEHTGVVIALLLLSGCLPGLMLVGAVLYRSSDSPSSGGDDRGGSGPDRPPSPPDPKSGGPPLPHADPARWRLRDHDRPARGSVQPRRVHVRGESVGPVSGDEGRV